MTVLADTVADMEARKMLSPVAGAAIRLLLLTGCRRGEILTLLHEAAPDLTSLRIHDLRHSFASFAVMDGAALYLVGKVLSHRQSRTTELYAHVADDPLHATAELAARRIATAMLKTAETDD